MFQAQNRETINGTLKVAVSFKVITTTKFTRSCYTKQHQNRKVKTKTKNDFFWSEAGLVHKTDGLRPHYWWFFANSTDKDRIEPFARRGAQHNLYQLRH